MSGIREFWVQVDASGALSDEFDSLMDDAGEIPAEQIVALGAKHGFDFQVDDLRMSLSAAAGRELSDDEMEGVAGGTSAKRGVINDHIGAYNFKVEVDGVTDGAFKFFRPQTTGIISF